MFNINNYILLINMSKEFDILLINIQKQELHFVNENLKLIIKITIDNFLPNLNSEDKNILLILTTFLLDLISYKYGFDSLDSEYYKQWYQNDNKDLKGIILLLLPFIDDKNNSYLLKKITNLNQLLYVHDKKYISKNILNSERQDILQTDFTYGNMALGLMKNIDDNDSLLELYDDNNKLIYKIMHHNMIGLLQTLEIINGKSYINWINIVPLNLNNYIDSNIFIKTRERLNEYIKLNKEKDKLQLLSNNLINYAGLWFGDFYNILRIKYYEEIIKVKWLIFPYEISSNKFYLIQGLNKMFNLDSILNSEYQNFNDMNDEQYIFINIVKKLIENIKYNIYVTNSKNVEYEILRYLLIYLISNNNIPSNNITKKFNLFKENDTEMKDDDFTKIQLININNIKEQDIIDCLIYISKNNIEELWNYLKKILDKFKYTTFGKYLIIDNNKKYSINNNYYYEPLNNKFKLNDIYINNVKNKINLKNIYNIAKSLCHKSVKNDKSDKSDWKLMEKSYLSLEDVDKIEFFNRLFTNNYNWINLKGNFKRQFININYDYKNILDTIIKAFQNSFDILVFEDLVSTGILGKFVLNLTINDKNLSYGLKKKLLKEYFIKNKKDWDESYYYLTNDKFKNMDTLIIEEYKNNNSDKYTEYNYFTLVSETHAWPFFYAVDWISQISFFHHYIYHQVLYVTGATGQGKSTQVPKLLLYALKAIDYKNNGKVVCTQPRIEPTTGNANRISVEVGLQIEHVVNNSNLKVKTNNYNIQYKYEADEHTNTNINHGFLRIMTDGSLLETIKNNIVMKEQVKNKYNSNNIYDIIIVDEAHEHNINMDIIIALSKQTCYFNNMIKLIIVSATMDDDEPIYRRYFNKINDNLSFPMKVPLKHPLLDIDKFIPQTKYMDRRYHISPPGETTQHKVEEIYLDNFIENDSENKNAENAQNLGYKQILDICNKSTVGEILFFATGQQGILDAIEYLNKHMPPGNIALPYFAKLNNIYKNIIVNIDKKISSIKTKRNRVHLDWGSKYIEDITVPNGLYKRAVIIATNVAEASITITSLKYVVDNGYSKVNKYDQVSNTTKLEVEKISESSRIQRKGRVGRTGDGIVYYMYKKDGRKNIKPKYKINQEDIVLTILNLLCNYNDNNSNILEEIKSDDANNYKRLIVSNLINPNNYNIFKNYYNSNKLIPNYTELSGLFELYKNNYILNTNEYKYYYDDTDETFNEFNVFNNGQIISNIMDQSGLFYLIHPFENDIKRNILNNIILFEEKNNNIIGLDRFVYIFSYLLNKNLIIDVNSTQLYYYNDELIDKNRKFIKSELGNKISKINQLLDIKIDDSITLIAAKGMNCLIEVYEIQKLLELINYSLPKLINKNIKWKNFKNIYSSNINSDIIFIYNILSKFKLYFKNLSIFNSKNNNLDKRLNEFSEESIKLFNKLKKQYKLPPLNYDIDMWNKLSALKNKGTLNSVSVSKLFTDLKTNDLFKLEILNNTDEITKWCNNNYINIDIINSFLNKLVYYKYKLSNIDEIIGIDIHSNYNKYLYTGSIDERIIRSFLYGRSTQITIKTDNTNIASYLNFKLFNVNISNTFNNTNTVTNLSNYLVFYLNYIESPTETDTIMISIMSHIDPKWLIPANPLFMNPKYFSNNFNIYNEKKLIESIQSDCIDKLKKEITNNWNQGYNIWDTNELPLLQYYSKTVTKIISMYMKN